jgi:hypothetical protein
MQLNKVGIALIAFFGIAGAAFAIVPILIGVPGEVAGILASIGVIWVFVAAGLLWLPGARRRRPPATTGSSGRACAAPRPCSPPTAAPKSTRCR